MKLGTKCGQNAVEKFRISWNSGQWRPRYDVRK